MLYKKIRRFCCNLWATHFKYNIRHFYVLSFGRSFSYWFRKDLLVPCICNWHYIVLPTDSEAWRCRRPAYWKVCFHYWIHMAWILNGFLEFFDLIQHIFAKIKMQVGNFKKNGFFYIFPNFIKTKRFQEQLIILKSDYDGHFFAQGYFGSQSLHRKKIFQFFVPKRSGV